MVFLHGFEIQTIKLLSDFCPFLEGKMVEGRNYNQNKREILYKVMYNYQAWNQDKILKVNTLSCWKVHWNLYHKWKIISC